MPQLRPAHMSHTWLNNQEAEILAMLWNARTDLMQYARMRRVAEHKLIDLDKWRLELLKRNGPPDLPSLNGDTP